MVKPIILVSIGVAFSIADTGVEEVNMITSNLGVIIAGLGTGLLITYIMQIVFIKLHLKVSHIIFDDAKTEIERRENEMK